MSALGMLNVAIGIIFVFLLLSLICSAINEVIENFLKKRASDLEQGICQLLQPKDAATGDMLLKKFYSNPFIHSLYQGSYTKAGKNLPSYIPASNFALALLDMIKEEGGNASAISTIDSFVVKSKDEKGNTVVSLQPLKTAVLNWADSHAQKAIYTLIELAENDLDKARKNIEKWYDSSMDRVSGWYKRRVQKILIILGFVLAIVMNADTIALVKSLTNDPALQNSMVAAAQEFAKADSTANTPESAKDRARRNIEKLNELRLPIGWDWGSAESAITDSTAKKDSAVVHHAVHTAVHMPNYYLAVPDSFSGWMLKIFGWLITGLAVSLGAPFWFDVLNKVMVIRSTVKPHEKSPEEASEDRQKK
jgi:hypothetical protein